MLQELTSALQVLGIGGSVTRTYLYLYCFVSSCGTAEHAVMVLDGVSALDLLDADPEPCFIIDLQQPQARSLVWKNAALVDDAPLLSNITSINPTSTLFWRWIRRENIDAHLYTFSWKAWITFTYANRWCIVRGQPHKVKEKSNGNSGCRSGESSPLPDHDYSKFLWPRSPNSERQESPLSQEGLAEHKKLMALSDVGVFEFDLDGTLIYANESWYKLSGHPRQEEMHTGFSFMDLVYPDDAEMVISMWKKLSEGISVDFKMRWKSSEKVFEDGPDANTQWVFASCVPIKNNGQVTSIAGHTVNISAQKRSILEAKQRAKTLERARASEARFSRFMGAAPIGVGFYSPEKICTYCNDQFFKITGHPEVEYDMIDWQSFVEEEDIPIVQGAFETLVMDKKPTSIQFRLRRTWRGPDNVDRACWVQGDSYPELDDDGDLISMGGTVIDISQIKFSEELQKMRTIEALEAKRQQENFIDMTSHEMRNPLSAVIQCADSVAASLGLVAGAVDLLDRDANADLDKIRQEVRSSLDAVQTIAACSSHQKRIIDDVLTLSKLNGGLLLITPVRVEATAVIADTVRIFELECSKLKIKISFVKSASLDAVGVRSVRLDPSRLTQILINFITNAIKFTSNCPAREIVVTLGASENRFDHSWPNVAFTNPPASAEQVLDGEEWGTGRKICLWVTVGDTGCGLTVAQQQSLFARFSQATPKTHVRYGGSGLGLFISKSLAEKQGGGVGVQSEAGKGSTFAFYVSARTAPTPRPRLNREKTLSPLNEEESSEDRIRKANYSVLIVEDNIVNQKILAKQLRKLNCQVHVADHGKAALDFLATTRHWKGKQDSGVDLSIVLLDMEMPVMDGLTCAREIRKLQSSGHLVNHIPVIAVSANARSEQIAMALDAGVDDSQAKPFRVGEILPKLLKLALRRKTTTAKEK